MKATNVKNTSVIQLLPQTNPLVALILILNVMMISNVLLITVFQQLDFANTLPITPIVMMVSNVPLINVI